LPHQIYIDNSITYTIAPEVEVPLGERTWALVEAEVVDELTGQPPIAPLTIESTNLGVFPRVAEDGIVGLAGIPVHAFSQLKTVSYTVDLTISANRYIPVNMQVPIITIPTFPALFNTTDVGQVALHRAPLAIRGRVAVSSGVTNTPAPGAAVSVTGIWRTVPPVNVVVPPSPPDLVSLMPGFYFGRSSAATQITQQPLVPVVGADKRLLLDAQQGDAFLQLSDCIGLAINDVLAVDGDDPNRTEYMTIKAIFAASTPDQPAKIQLTYALQTTHRFNAPVRKVNLGAAGASTPLSADAIVGDVCAFVGSVATLQPATTVKVSDGTNPDEYHAASYFVTTTDALGFYRLPALSRVAQLNLEANIGAVPPPITEKFVPDYSQEENKVDVVF
jgi:hypothetical protein